MVLQYIFVKILKFFKSISNEWLCRICWSSLLLGIFIMKRLVVFSLTSFGTLKYDCVIKKDMFSFLPLINDSGTIWSSSLRLSISAIISSNTTNIFRLLSGLYYSTFLQMSSISFECSIKAYSNTLACTFSFVN